MARSAPRRIPAFGRRRAQQLGATARTVAQAAPETLTVVRSAVTSAGRWLGQARALAGEIRRVDEAVREAEESIKLNPLRLRLPAERASLGDGLQTLEHAAITIRGLARSAAHPEQEVS